MENILTSYLRRLTNLSGNNRSILLTRLVGSQSMDIHELDYALDQPSFKIIDQLVARKPKIGLCPILDSRNQSSNKLSTRLRNLAQVDKFIYEERGGKDLYVGWPFAKGKFSDGTIIRCPVIFFPVALSQDKGNWQLEIRKDVNITLNKSFLLAYAYYNKVNLHEDLLERVFDDFDNDITQFRKQLYDLFNEHNFEINFNSENFDDKLLRFETLNRSQLEENERDGEIKFYPQAVLGIFPQAGSYLVPDYLKLIEENTITSLNQLFTSKYLREGENDTAESGSEDSFLDRVKEEQTFTPFKMDAYQENAIKAVKLGNSIVVQGPPGTGKSQLICNLISDYIARGKNVLMVCQKRAALDVVYQRLKSKNVHDYVGLVHDFKNDRKAIYSQIAHQIDKLDDYKTKNNSIDAIHLERQFYQESRNIDRLIEEMREFKSALYDEKECGKSIKELYLTSNPLGDTINIKQEYMHLDFQHYEKFKIDLDRYLNLASRFENDGYLFAYRPSYAGFGLEDFTSIKNCIQGVSKVARLIERKSTEILGSPIDFSDASWFLDRRDEIEKFLELLKNETVYKYFKSIIKQEQKIEPIWLSNIEKNFMQCFNGYGPETSLPSSELGKFQEVLERSLDARKSFFKWLNWKLFSKDKIYVSRVLIANNLKSTKEGFNILVEKIDNRLNLEHNLSKLNEKPLLIDRPQNYRKIDYQNWFYYQKLAVNANNAFISFRNLKEYFNIGKLTSEALKNKLNALITELSEVNVHRNQWKHFISGNTVSTLVSDPGKEELYLSTLSKDFDSLCEYDALRTSLEAHKKDIVDKLLEKVVPMDVTKALQLLDNSLKLAWINHIETKYPSLRLVSSGKFSELEQALKQSVSEKVRLSNEILLLKARERTYHDLEYNRLNNRVTYRELEHQVSKKRRIWPIRKLISHFDREVFDLIPCWLVSPESASAIFPMEEIFDLVIFDEASQCFSEKGIPAIYRGRQVVVTGDDKQLQPSDLYRVRWEDEEEEVALEVDSLLDLAKTELKQVYLRGHYRSESLDLIEFSNRHFYGGKLRLLPSYSSVVKKSPSIQYIKVDGEWDKQTNRAEAEVIVNLVLESLIHEADKEIGIVTFNIRQRELIADLLEEKAIAASIPIPDSLIIKNIENIQGDEKDIIYFSTAYAPDKNGKLRLNFGSLSQSGGENRLNVAITRARKNIVLVTSIMPAALKTDDTKNDGPRMFKKYLEYAYQVSSGLFRPAPYSIESWSQDWYLSNQLKQLKISGVKDLKVQEEMPFADLTVYKNNVLHGLILTDDNLYHESVSMKDAHVYKPNAYRKKGWLFERIYSREFWINKEMVEDRLLKFYSKEKSNIDSA